MGERGKMPIRKELATIIDLEKAERVLPVGSDLYREGKCLLHLVREIDLPQCRLPKSDDRQAYRDRCPLALVQDKAVCRGLAHIARAQL